MSDGILLGLDLSGVFPSRIATDIANERGRQEHLRTGGKFKATCATIGPDAMSAHECLAVLVEEVGEVARAILQTDRIAGDSVVASGHVREELIQVAAVCVAWVSRLDGGGIP